MDDLIVSSKVMLGAEGSDPNVAPVPYREPNVAKKLTFGYYTFGMVARHVFTPGTHPNFRLADGFIKSSPAAQRAVQEAVDALRSKDHECVEIKIPPGTLSRSRVRSESMFDTTLGFFGESCQIVLGLTAADGYQGLQSHLGPDPLVSPFLLCFLGATVQNCARSLGPSQLVDHQDNLYITWSVNCHVRLAEPI